MALDVSQLSLPQIAAAVAAGELRLAEAEAELRRRPVEPQRRIFRQPRPAPPPRPLSSADIMKALAETRREVQKATKHLSHLTRRLDELAQAAGALQPVPRRGHGPTGGQQRRMRLDGTRGIGQPVPLEEPELDLGPELGEGAAA